MASQPDLTTVQEACRAFPALFNTLHLGAVSADGQPEARYAPYVVDEGRYRVSLSELARHTANLSSTARVSVLFIDSEGQARHLFARQRLTLACQVCECSRGSARFEEVLDVFEPRFGPFVQAIRPPQDFHLFELVPVSGAYVAGFARGYTFDGADPGQLRHRNDQGHQPPDNASAHWLGESLPS